MTHALARSGTLPAIPQLPSLLVPAMQHLVKDNTLLAVSAGLPKAVVVKRDGTTAETRMTLDRSDAERLIAWGYLEVVREGRITLYGITSVGRMMVPETKPTKDTFRSITEIKPQKESPVRILARKKDANGKPFLGAEHLEAANIFSEDYRVAGFEDHPVGSLREVVEFLYPAHTNEGVMAAHERLCAAVDALGPDLGDIAIRCCCLGEGIETAERRMGWSARSGKIVLRIALRRLVMHYDQVGADFLMVS
ncbi:MAG: DUF6456 domain-containing protein [Pseudomonadota bacterium]